MLTIYFSGTGNTKYIAQLFSKKMNAECLSIEDDTHFFDEIKKHDVITLCYPIYGSRVPRIMREFAIKHMSALAGKKIIIFVTQLFFSGDGARVFTDMFEEDAITVIYAEHFNMPNNICNSVFRKPSEKRIQKYLSKAEAKMERACHDIKNGVIKKRGFNRFSQIIGNIQGVPWQGNSKKNGLGASQRSIEYKAMNDVRIDDSCTSCNVCVEICPMRNLENNAGEIIQKGNCTVCYRCVNHCPDKAITVMMTHKKPRWQYKGVGD